MARLKTAPRVILGLALVGVIGYGVNYWIDHRPKPTAPEVAQPVLQPVDQAVQPVAVQPVAQPQVVQAPPPAPVPAPSQSGPGTHDAGLNALIKGGSK